MQIVRCLNAKHSQIQQAQSYGLTQLSVSWTQPVWTQLNFRLTSRQASRRLSSCLDTQQQEAQCELAWTWQSWFVGTSNLPWKTHPFWRLLLIQPCSALTTPIGSKSLLDLQPTLIARFQATLLRTAPTPQARRPIHQPNSSQCQSLPPLSVLQHQRIPIITLSVFMPRLLAKFS